MLCSKCGSVLRDGAAFCGICGSRVEIAAATPAGFLAFSPPQGKSGAAAQVNNDGKFAARYLGIIIFGALFLIMLLIGLANGLAAVKTNIFQSLAVLGTAAIGMAVIGRTGGIDLSIAGLMVLSNVLIGLFYARGSIVLGILISLIVCIAVGFINGIFSIILKIPSFLVTLATLLFTRSLCVWLIKSPIKVMVNYFPPAAFYIVFLLALAGGFSLIFFTQLGKPFANRDENGKKPVMLYLFAYAFTAFLAFLAGTLLTFQFHMSAPYLSMNNEYYLLFALLFAGSGTVFDNRVAPVLMAVLGSLFCIIYQRVLTLIDLPNANISIFALFLLLALALDRVYRKNLFPFKPL